MSYLRIVWTYLRIGIMNELQYRINFIVQVFQSLIALTTGLIALYLVFSYTTDLAGWRRPELLIVMGVHIVVGGLIRMTIEPNMGRLMQDVEEGTLDYALTKPEDSQLIISVREFRLWQAVDVVMGTAIIGAALWQPRGEVGPIEAAAFAVALALGMVMAYSVWLMLSTGAFWFVRVGNILEVFQSLYQAGRWPVDIYPGWLRIGLTVLVPVAFAVTVPAQAMTGRLTGYTLAAAAALAGILLLAARRVWLLGLRRYSGASA
jgi:ABC-2 type transport system permease protein